MVMPVLVSLGVIFITILIHGLGTSWGVQKLAKNKRIATGETSFHAALYTLSLTAIFLMVLHFLEIAVWATVFMIIPDVKELQTFEESMYFSMVTYATLGYGDITLGPYWRIMSGFAAMDGILLFGWSTAMFFSAVQKIFGQVKTQESKTSSS